MSTVTTDPVHGRVQRSCNVQRTCRGFMMMAYGWVADKVLLATISGPLVLAVTPLLLGCSALLGMLGSDGGPLVSRWMSFAGWEVPGLDFLDGAGSLDSNTERLLPTPILLASLISSTDGIEKAPFLLTVSACLSAAIFFLKSADSAKIY